MLNHGKLPVYFIGHGSPMNIIQDNAFTRDLKKIGNTIPKPEAILIISAHFLTRGTFVTCESHPRQIYDFYGFPKELYEFKYRPSGHPEIAKSITDLKAPIKINCTNEWGLDHAAYMILGHIYPEADIPTIELSLDYYQKPEYHYFFARSLKKLREMGVLIIGSGNIIHTFQYIEYNQYAKPYPWAVESDYIIKENILNLNHENLIHYERLSLSPKAFQTNEHYLPMLYILALQDENEPLEFVHEGFQHGSISHRSFRIG